VLRRTGGVYETAISLQPESSPTISRGSGSATTDR